MTVNPGFGGQHYIPACTEKVRRLRAMAEARAPGAGHPGGRRHEPPTRPGVVAGAGANVLVAGTAVFGASDYRHAIAGCAPRRSEGVRATLGDSSRARRPWRGRLHRPGASCSNTDDQPPAPSPCSSPCSVRWWAASRCASPGHPGGGSSSGSGRWPCSPPATPCSATARPSRTTRPWPWPPPGDGSAWSSPACGPGRATPPPTGTAARAGRHAPSRSCRSRRPRWPSSPAWPSALRRAGRRPSPPRP